MRASTLPAAFSGRPRPTAPSAPPTPQYRILDTECRLRARLRACVVFPLLLVLGVACPESAPDLTPEAAAEAERARKAAERLETLSADVAAAVSGLRQLPFPKPVRKGLKSREELRAYLEKTMDKKQPKERLDAIGKALGMLGLLPPGFDLHKLILDLLAEQVAGFYDPEAGALFLINEWNLVQVSIIAHELTHALQDQNFDLQSLPLEDEKREDLANAVRCVVEGEGMLVMMLHVSRAKSGDLGWIESFLGKGYGAFLDVLDQDKLAVERLRESTQNWVVGTDKLSTAPSILRESLILPYLQGMVFVYEALKRGGWQGVNALYGDLPQSTEQILHPAKYFGTKDRPTTVEIPAPETLSPTGFQLIFQSVLGELYVAVLMRDFLGKAADRVSWEGWDGDQFLAFHHPGEDKGLFVWATVWDSAQDAEEFAAAYERMEAARRAAMEKRQSPAPSPAAGQEARKPQPGAWPAALVRRKGPEVLIVRGQVARDALEETAQKVWKTRKLREAEVVRAKGGKKEGESGQE